MNKENLPKHIAIIPDGNRRWARQRKLAPWHGHFAGAEATKELLETAFDLGIKYVSIWGGSLDNLTKRPKAEVKFLFKIYEQYFRKLAKSKEICENKVKVNVFGRWSEILPKKGVEVIKELMGITKNYNQYLLNFFIGYNGTDEMLEAIKGILKKSQAKERIKVSPQLLKEHLWTSDLPPVDLLIRTGLQNDPHNSTGFMMWHCANSQLYFAKEFYPDFNKQAFLKAIRDFQKRERRKGR